MRMTSWTIHISPEANLGLQADAERAASASDKQGTIHVMRADITTLPVDAIVNAANKYLRGGGGVDGAIQSAAGPQLLQDGLEYVRRNGPLPTGEAVITPAYNLPARFVIHTVGPIWGKDNDEPVLLANAYRNSIALAAAHGLKHIAFPAISCGVYGFPVEQAAPISLKEIISAVQQRLITTVTMTLHSEHMHTIWCQAAKALLGTPDGE